MKLSELVNFKTELDKLSVLSAQSVADQEVAKVTHLIESFPMTAGQSNNFNHNRFEIKSKFEKFEQELNDDWEAQFTHGTPVYVDEEVEHEKYGTCYTFKQTNPDYWVDREGIKEYNERINNGIRLFGKYYRGLWD